MKISSLPCGSSLLFWPPRRRRRGWLSIPGFGAIRQRSTLFRLPQPLKSLQVEMTTDPPTFPGIRTADNTQQAKQEHSTFFFGVDPQSETSFKRGLFGVPVGANFSPNAFSTNSSYSANWRENDGTVQGLRTRNVVLIEQMLSSHAPHDVLTQVPENIDWHSKTFQLAVKIERLMFNTATSREDYLNESTLRTRVQNLSRNLIQMRKRKNMISEKFTALSMS
ncbi:hypothetical protein F441_20721 [Phytophthora nicotianae CJ01A1]|uniref:Mediator complex subunit 15 KIX domain-containing protein n=4 Tax=Phytophthora nicotianae TaxID=4792 RepID=W2VWM7_PHYNI|nr:hypothetical protein L914_20037 [Phytophthora nicotianae]ETP02163.1 hypothetical protein F441_20721 [Phytophthora nicotianae CJ01A1]